MTLVLALGLAAGLILLEFRAQQRGHAPQAATGPLYSIRSVAAMNHARVFATATSLAGGQVLIAGGIDSAYNYLASAELFDPRSQTFMPLGQMTMPRASYTATLLANGRVLIAGGLICTGGKCTYLSSAELYDPVPRRFTAVGSMSVPRASHSATLMDDGTVLIAGGANADGALASAELYDPVTASFSPTGSMGSPRLLHTATLLNDDRVLIVGGRGCAGECDDNSASATAEVYDPVKRQFSPAGPMNEARLLHSAALLPNGRVLISGGRSCKGDCEADDTLRDAELYDPGTNSFTPAGEMIAARAAQQAVALPNGQVFIYGGAACAKRGGCNYLNSGELYMPDTGDFISAGSGSVAGVNSVAALLPNAQVLIAGGRVRGGISSGAEVFSLNGN